jgi:very-short-patch-repair endonuclease
MSNKKWIRDETGLFVTNCPSCGRIRKTKKRPYENKTCSYKECHSGNWKKGETKTFTAERNKKVSEGKRKWWENQDKSILNNWLGNYRGSDKHIELCKSNQQVASKNAMRNKISKPEKEYAKKLNKEGVVYKQQYYLEGYYFDFYIPSKNLLIEIDGKFFHPSKIEECIYEIQKRNFIRDIKKNEVAKNNNYSLKRIRV